MTDIWIAIAGLPVGIWFYLLLFRGRFWLELPKPAVSTAPESWPAVAAVVPARNEAGVVGQAVGALLRQDYPAPFRVILVDDNSEDGTAAEARAAAEAAGAGDRLTVVSGKRLAQGWTGKMWAVHQGLGALEKAMPSAQYVLLTDADIDHAPDSLRNLVARACAGDAKAGRYKLVSLMARLRTDTFAEKALIPAYVFFFQMLYPFAWINDPKSRMAGAAGGCMLVERKALKVAGGIAAIKDALIDDCALGRVMKKQGPIWLGLADNVSSLRGYPAWRDIWMLIARSAFTQLNHSALLLIGCVLGMVFTYLLAPILTADGNAGSRGLGVMAWAMMTLSYLPTLYYYRRSVLWAPFLPLIAVFYLLATMDSARRHWLGRGGEWKGRMQAKKTA
ncbi:MAG: glycosyltransferase [Rhodospirillaceae bacterium]|nr:MAG: glycosyltransferase [Rhodospirillaceae bacterium]